MNPWDEEDRAAYRQVEEALSTYELEPAPANLAKKIMGQVRADPRAALPRFRLTAMDYALSLFAAAMLALAVVISLSLPVEVERYLHLEITYWVERIRLEPLPPILAIGGLAIFFIGTGALIVMGKTIFRKEQGSAR